MAETHSPRERVKLFGMGFRRGAGMKAIPNDPPGLKEDCDFQNGYREGRHAYAAAMEIARKHFGAPPPSFLRIAQEDLEAQADAEMFEEIETTVYRTEEGELASTPVTPVDRDS